MTESLFHYCSTQSFHSIIESRKIRLSALSLSNDSLEGKLVARSLLRLATAAKISEVSRSRLIDSFEMIERAFEGLGFCLSEEPDLLSQWRGYASDGFGLSIGFSKQFLSSGNKQFEFALRQVSYEQDEHDIHVKPTFEEVMRFIADGAFDPIKLGLLTTKEEYEGKHKHQSELRVRLTKALFALFPKLYVLKSRAFREEREWRLLSHMAWGISEDCQYRATADRLIPFREVDLWETPNEPIITTVILGPKHATPINAVEDFLGKAGFNDVNVERSEATYR